MTYATQQLTQALQELTRSPRPFEAKIEPQAVQSTEAGIFEFSREIESFLDTKRTYSEQTKRASFGSY